jgi:hypothetical protein
MRKAFIFLVCSSLFFAFCSSPAYAAKIRVKKSGGGGGMSFSSARLSRPTNSIVVTFQNLTYAKRVRYELNYTASGIPQGAMGTIATTGLVSDSRDLYFGTCSHGVCTPHYNISNATLTISTDLTAGGTNIKRYRIKI